MFINAHTSYKRNKSPVKTELYLSVSLGEFDVRRVCELGLIFKVRALDIAATDFVCLILLNMVSEDPGRHTPIRKLLETSPRTFTCIAYCTSNACSCSFR